MATLASVRARGARPLSGALPMLLLAVIVAGLLPGPGRSGPAPLVEVVVRAADAIGARLAVERHGGRVTHDLPVADAVGAEVPRARVAGLRGDPAVRDVAPNTPVEFQGRPSPLHAASAVYPRAVGADHLWSDGITGRGVNVAVVDTGIARVPDLDGRLVAGVDLSGEGDPFADSFGHGTFVAGTIAGDGRASRGAYRGVAPEAGLVSIKIAGRDGASDITHVLAAIQWAVSFRDVHGIRVLNLSLGTDSTQPYRLSPLDAAVERAWDAGIVVVVSASNRGPGAGTVTKPGDDPLVVTVGASDDRATERRRDDVMAGFSGQGPTAADGLAKPDLVAPGRSLISLRAPGSKVDAAYPASRVGESYFKGSGTSFSTGVVSGAAALVLQRTPGLAPGQVKSRLLRTAAPGPTGDRMVDGHGALDARAAALTPIYDDANAGIPRSLGTGSLDLDRGSLGVEIETGSLVDALGRIVPIRTLLTGDRTAQDRLFDAVEYFGTEWNGSTWYGSTWYGSTWYGSTWYGSTWYGSTWYGSTWYGSTWYATAWE